MKNTMILNNEDIGISEIEYDINGNLRVTDKSGKYCFVVCIYFNTNDINSIEIGETKNIHFNEYCISENNESAMIWPIISNVKRIENDIYALNFKFENIDSDVCYMNKRKCFDIKLDSLECNILVNIKDARNNVILYKY